MKTEPIRRPISALPVGKVMHRGVIACDRGTSLTDVARTMAEHSVHCVVVDNDSGEGIPWGVVSDLDLVAAATVRSLDEQTAGGSAASPVLMVTPAETLERAAQLMTEHGTAHLLVVDSEVPVGVLSTLDIASVLARGG